LKGRLLNFNLQAQLSGVGQPNFGVEEVRLQKFLDITAVMEK